MWRYVVAAVLVVVAAKVGEYFGDLTNDETGGHFVGTAIAMATIACLWPVYFGLRDPPDE